MEKETRKLLFLKTTGVLIGEITPDTDESALDLTQFNTKIISIDPANEFWYGDYATGEIKSRIDKPVIHESILKYNTNLKILKEYPIHSQLSIIIDLLESTSLPKTQEFTTMHEFITAARAEHAEKVQVFSSTPDAYIWRSVADDDIEYAKKIV